MVLYLNIFGEYIIFLDDTMKVMHFTPSSLEEAAEIIKNALTSKKLMIIYGCCNIFYEGRGASRLTPGDRIVIIKRDGSVLVHRPFGYSPVNWQPETTDISLSISNKELVIKAIRTTPREVLEIRFSQIYSITHAILDDKGEFIEYLSEHEIRDYLSKNPSFIEEGLVTIDIEKHVEPGFIDLYCRDKHGNIVVIEIKRVTASKDAILQLKRYIDSIRKYMSEKRIRGIIVAPSISKAALELVERYKFEYKRIDIGQLYKVLRSKQRARDLLYYITTKKK